MKIGIAAIMKNEVPYLIEWVAFHRVVGIDRFFIADNDSTDGMTDVLSALDKLGLVDHIPFPNQPGRPPQLDAYSRILEEYASAVDWLAFIDADEFLMPTGGRVSCRDVIEHFDGMPDVGSIMVNWATFGSSGHLDPSDELVLERYQMRATKSWDGNFHYKSIVRMAAVPAVHSTPHFFTIEKGYTCVQVDGRSLVDHPIKGIGLSEEVIWEPMRLNHYVVKSEGEFFGRKGPLGRATVVGEKKGHNYFIYCDRNDESDPINSDLISMVKREVDSIRSRLSEIGVAAPTNTLKSAAPARFSRGNIDHITVIDDTISVTGWATLLYGAPIPEMAIKVNGVMLRTVCERIDRTDVVANVSGSSLNCGFRLKAALPSPLGAKAMISIAGADSEGAGWFRDDIAELELISAVA